ncbi:unnamed protein product [Acanthoscelides obtectus]|nr:unnamed protein product [Acanthoscelides obtectus]CAK1680384.1 Cytosolic sulfotransferase 17 [Acanthoscelides obtectus]
MLMHDLDFEGAKEDLSERVILVESDRLEDSHKYQLERFRDTLGLLLKKYKEGPIAVKTHLPWVMLPKQIQEFKKRPKIIYLVRNPKSLVCSLVHWKNLMHGKVEPVEGVADRFMDGTEVYHPYWQHVLQFWQHRHEPNIMILRYEEMVKDPPAMIKRVAEFLGKKLTAEQLTKLADHVSVDSMKKNRAVNNEPMIERRRAAFGLGKTNENHIRKGKADSYKEEMLPELIVKMDKWIEENTKDTEFNVL